MIKKILLYVVFAIPSLVFGAYQHLFEGADIQSSIALTILFLGLTYVGLTGAIITEPSSKKAQNARTPIAMSIILTRRELQILATALSSELDEHMRAKQIGVTSTVAMHIQDCIEEIKHLQVKLDDAIKDLDSVK